MTRGKTASLRKASPIVNPLAIPSREIRTKLFFNSSEPTVLAVISKASKIGKPALSKEDKVLAKR